MRLFDLTPAELAVLIEGVYLASQGTGLDALVQDDDLHQQLRVYLSEKPTLAEEVLGLWLRLLPDDRALAVRREAELWFQWALLGVTPAL